MIAGRIALSLRPVLLAFIMFAAPASAAPTCQDRGGNTVRCGTESAMLVGWAAPEWDRHFAGADKGEIVKAVAMLLLLFVLIALLPDFQGGRWDRQEGDEEE
jgi:hypothetical protein